MFLNVKKNFLYKKVNLHVQGLSTFADVFSDIIYTAEIVEKKIQVKPDLAVVHLHDYCKKKNA